MKSTSSHAASLRSTLMSSSTLGSFLLLQDFRLNLLCTSYLSMYVGIYFILCTLLSVND
jgi:hypothetical protein